MDDTSSSLNPDELSAEDLAIIQAFDALDDLELPDNLDEQNGNATPISLLDGTLGTESSEDMLILFASEADEDIGTMKRALQQLEQDNQVNSPGLVTLSRTAHKLKGTSGAMGCEAMSAIALRIEEEIQLIKSERIELLTGIMALVHATAALEATLQSVMNDGQENPALLQELLKDLAGLNANTSLAPEAEEEQENTILHINPKENTDLLPTTAAAQVDLRYLSALMSHTEQLIELHTPLQSAQKQVTKSLMELQAAYARLRRLEGLLSNLIITNIQASGSNQQRNEVPPSSSLVARILQEARQRATRQAQFRQRASSHPTTPTEHSSEPALWDEMEMDRFTENKILLQSFSEAIADVATASGQLRAAFAQLNTLIEQQMRQTTTVRNDTLRLRSAPFSVLLTRVQRAVQMIAQAHNQSIQFEASGETTEIDQDILEFLAGPLLRLVRTSVADSLLSAPMSSAQQRNRIWLQAQTNGNEITIELGFSMPIPGGALETLRSPIQQLHGSIAAQRNSAGGISYQLRFPRTQGTIQGLLVQANGQSFVIPLPQINSIDYKHQQPYAQVYHLASLLGFAPSTGSGITSLPPVILLAGSHRRVGLQVDEIIGEIELVMKPLAAHLQRPGVVGTSIDGAGNVLLILDLHTLIQYDLGQRRNNTQRPVPPVNQTSEPASPSTVLIADDSVYMRQSLRHTLEHAGYKVIEARDGIEALEYFTSEQIPDILLLDIEMPNLNGYDLLTILHSQLSPTDCKTILLTSRSSEKHRQRAMELGAYAFLSKPCSQEVLLDTIHKVLTNTPLSI